MFEDMNLVCIDCSKDFELSKEAQTHFSTRGLTSPRRCHDCRRDRAKQNEKLTCTVCGTKFDFPPSVRAAFEERGLTTPKRCAACRSMKARDCKCLFCGNKTSVIRIDWSNAANVVDIGLHDDPDFAIRFLELNCTNSKTAESDEHFKVVAYCQIFCLAQAKQDAAAA